MPLLLNFFEKFVEQFPAFPFDIPSFDGEGKSPASLLPGRELGRASLFIGNNYRIIAVVLFVGGVMELRFVGTHAEYDKIKDCSVI